MMSTIEKLTREHNRKLIVSATLYLGRSLDGSNEDYRQLLERSRLAVKSSDNAEKFEIVSGSQRKEVPMMKSSRGRQKMWTGFGGMPKACLYYQYASTSFMVYILMKNTLPLDIFDGVLNWSMPLRCFFPGRFIINKAMAETTANFICFLHIIWRVWHYWYKPIFPTSMGFVAQSRKDVARQCMPDGRDYKHFQRVEPGSIDFLLRYVMCYPIQMKTRIVYRLRPNRTIEAYDKLARVLAKFVFYMLTILFTMTVVIVTICTIDLLLDINYVESYPRCAPTELFETFQRGELSYWSIGFNWHKIYATFFDGFENYFVWFESGVAICIVVPIANFLNYDICLYWQGTHKRLKLLLRRLRENYENERLSWDESSHDSEMSYFDQLDKSYMAIGHTEPVVGSFVQQRYNFLSGICDGRGSLISKECSSTLELEDFVNEVQHELCDLFVQIEAADTIVSDIITMSCMFWTAVFAAFSYSSIKLRINGYTIGPVFTQVCSFLVFAVCGYSLLEMNRNMKKSYAVICAIMAYDKSKFKRRFLPLLEFFTVRKRASYTILHKQPYVTTTFLSVVGWTFSLAIVYDSLFLRQY